MEVAIPLAAAAAICIVFFLVYLALNASQPSEPEAAEPIAAARRTGGPRGQRARPRARAGPPPAEQAAPEPEQEDTDDAELQGLSRKERRALLRRRKKEGRRGGPAGPAAGRRQTQPRQPTHDEDSEDENDGYDGHDDPDDEPERLSAYEQARRQREAARQAEERGIEEEFVRRQEERERARQAEYDAWKGTMAVEGSGQAHLSEVERGVQRARVCEHIKACKIAVLDDVAREFELRTQEVIGHVRVLEAEGELTGAMDDRGKYIFVTAQEMCNMVDFVVSRGRIPIAELTKCASDLIALEPLVEFKKVDAAMVRDLDALIAA